MNTKITSRATTMNCAVVLTIMLLVSLLNNVNARWVNYTKVNIYNAGSGIININGQMVNNGDSLPAILNEGLINLTGNLVNTIGSVIDLSTKGGTVTLNGSGSQTITGTFKFNNLTINNSGGGVTLNSDTLSSITVNDTLTLANGIVTTNSDTLTLGSSSSILGGSIASYVIGNFCFLTSTGAATFVYPLGTADGYSPATIAFNNISVAGLLSATVTNTNQPEAGVNSLSRYWTITKDSNLTFDYYNATFEYLPQDFDLTNFNATTNESTMLWGEYSASSWTYPTITNRSPLIANGGLFGTITASDITSSFGDFTGVSFSVPVIVASGDTTLCQGGSVVLTDTSTIGGLTYQWQNSSNIIGTATNSSYTATESGSYSVIVTQSGYTQTSNTITVTVNPLPDATFIADGDTTFCQGDNVTFYALTPSGLNYQWKDNGAIATGISTNNTYIATVGGNYSLFVSDIITQCTDTSSYTMTVTVNPLPDTTFTIVGNTTFCQGDSVTFNANTTSGLTYQWKDNGADATGISTNSTYVATAGGNYSLFVTDNNTQCTNASSSPLTVTVNSLPDATFTNVGNTTFCQGDSVTFNANITDGLTYQWKDNAADAPGISTNSSYVATAGGNYSLFVTDINTQCADTSSSTVTVTVNSLPDATFTTFGNTTFCQGDSITFSANTTSGLTYQWKDNGADATGISTNNTYIVTVGGNYNLFVTASSTQCTDTTSSPITVTVNPLPDATFTTVGNTTFCHGNSVTFNANITDGLTYQWKNNGANAAGSSTNNTYIATVGGNYTLSVTDIITQCTDTSSSSIAVTVNPTPKPVILGDTVICAGTQRSQYTTDGGMSNYIWYVSSGGHITTNDGNMILVSWTTAGKDTVGVTYTNLNGCTGSSSYPVNINAIPVTPTITINGNELESSSGTGNQWYNAITGTGVAITGDTSSTITPTTSGLYYVIVTQNGCASLPSDTVTITGINTLIESRAFNLYPNPNDGNFSIEICGVAGETYTIEIWNTLSMKIFEQKITTSNTKHIQNINVSKLGTGVYTLKLINTNTGFKRNFIISR